MLLEVIYNMIIEIIVREEDNEIVAKKTALSFESAYEDLGKLERLVNKTYDKGTSADNQEDEELG